MSRYAVTAHDPRYRVIVGWDNPLATFFGEVFDTHEEVDEDDDPCCVLWTGTVLEEVVTVEALQACLAPFATLPAELVAHLRADQRQATPRTPLQERMVWLLDDREDQEVPF